MTPEQWDLLQTKIRSAAKRVAGQWPEVIEAEDLAQDMFVRLLESPDVITRLFTETEQVQGSFLIKMGHQVASREQQDYDRFSGNYMYDYAEVRGSLDRGILAKGDEDEWDSAESDLREGMENLAETNSSHFAEIVNRFLYEIVPDRLDKAAHNRVTRAVEALTEKMNRVGADRRKRWVEGPGSRTVLSIGESARAADYQQGFGD